MSLRYVKGAQVPTSLVLTVLGEDRPGLVESLAYLITAHEGNWLESRMAHLAGQFAGILRASVPDANAAGLINALQGLASHGLQVLVAQSTSDELARDSRWLTLDLVGNDHLGIIRDLAHALAQRSINIDELQTECTSAPMTGGMLFKATARLRVPLEVTVAELQVALDQLAHDLAVDITLEGPVRT
jgi:glycine cleavage system regulatory protein